MASNVSNQLTIILPTLNEAGNIGPLTTQIWNEIADCQIIVADDGSTDGTQEAVLALAKQGKPIQLLTRPGKPCLTDSIDSGIQAARTPFVGWMDADLSHPPQLIPQLLKYAETQGCAIATRFAPGGSQKKNTKDSPDSFLATVLSGIMNFLVRHWLNVSVTDYTSGFIVCKRELIADHRLVGDYGEYFIELVYYLSRTGVKIFEIPYESPARQWGESKTGASLGLLMRRGMKYLWLALRLRLPARAFGRWSLQTLPKN
ncbi:glycosyltransferase [bacterium]|jgi:dolichol-phosphate mannosyltransferase|nr:glycosyltransferase [bacterium]